MPKRHPDSPALRSCAVCRTIQPKGSMMRLVRRADGSVAHDATGKAAGRGTYLCADHRPATSRDAWSMACAERSGSAGAPESVLDEVLHVPAT